MVIPTYDNHQLLRERAIPSVLAQTHQNFEIVVVGDAAPDEARRTVEGFDDPRITFVNLGYRGPYPADPETRWLVAGVPPYNEAVRRAGDCGSLRSTTMMLSIRITSSGYWTAPEVSAWS